jgi:hypothetical protein
MAGHLDITRISTGRNPLSPASGTGTARRRARRRKTRRRNLFGPDRGGQPLTQRPAHEPAGVAPRTPRVTREQSCFDIRSERSQSQEIIPADARERSPLTGRHLSRIPSRRPAASWQELQAVAGACARTPLLPASRAVPLTWRAVPAAALCPAAPARHKRRVPATMAAAYARPASPRWRLPLPITLRLIRGQLIHPVHVFYGKTVRPAASASQRA